MLEAPLQPSRSSQEHTSFHTPFSSYVHRQPQATPVSDLEPHLLVIFFQPLHPGLCWEIFIQKVPGVLASKLLQSTRAFKFLSNGRSEGHDWSSLLSHW